MWKIETSEGLVKGWLIPYSWEEGEEEEEYLHIHIYGMNCNHFECKNWLKLSWIFEWLWSFSDSSMDNTWQSFWVCYKIAKQMLKVIEFSIG